jgi:hypothetical protein
MENNTRIGTDDGYGNIITGISKKVLDGMYSEIGTMIKDDMIYIHNKEGCRIATYKVV